MVLFYEKDAEELMACSHAELSKRLYKVTGMSSMTIQNKYHYGTVSLKHHQEARPETELKESKGVWKNESEYRSKITLLHTQLTFAVEGKDFVISSSGSITFFR